MISVISIVVSVVAIVLAVSSMVALKNHQQEIENDTQSRLPAHEHVWDVWGKPRIDLIRDPKDNYIVGEVVTQKRQCLSCGYIDYKKTTHKN